MSDWIISKILFLSLFGLATFAPIDVCLSQKAGEAGEELYEWSIKTYRLSSDVLGTGFVTKEDGQLNLPKMPSEAAKPEEIQKFIKQSSKVIEQFLQKHAVTLPPGTLAVMDLEHETLAVRTTGEAHGQIEWVVKNYEGSLDTFGVFRVDILQAKKGEAFRVMSEAIGKADHSELLESLEAQIGEGMVRMLDSNRIETKFGQEVKIKGVTDKSYPTEYELNEKESVTGSQSERSVGLTVELLPVVGSDRTTIDLSISAEYHLAPPSNRWIPTGNLNGKRVETKVTDFHVANVTTNTAMKDGQVRLIGGWPKAFNDKESDYVVAFLTAKIATLLSLESPVVADWLKEQGEEVLPTPPKVEPEFEGPAAKMIVRRFKITPSYLSQGDDRGRGPIDGFGPPAGEPTFQIKATVLDILRSQNIPFPEGSSANFIKETNELVVRNLPENIDLVEAFVGAIQQSYSSQIGFLLHVVQADGATLRKLDRESMGKADHSEIWLKLKEEIEGGSASIVQSAWLETKPGQSAKTYAVTEYIFSNDTYLNDGGSSAKASDVAAVASSGTSVQSIQPEFLTRNVGLDWEILPVIGVDIRTVDFSMAVYYHTAPPTERFEAAEKQPQIIRADSPEVDFHVGSLEVNSTMRSGMKRLVGVWKPKGSPELEEKDVLQAVFIEGIVTTLE